MCTLSIFIEGSKTIVTMNRDEYRSRHEANIIKQKINVKTELYYPVDKSSGGTWFGFNNHGIVMALLNRYQYENTQAVVSRGVIIPQLLQLTSTEQILNQLTQLIFDNYACFDVVIINHQQIIKYSWDGNKSFHNNMTPNQPFLLSSSSIDSQNILAHRANLFTSYHASKDNKDAKAILSDLHLTQDNIDTSSSIFMSRAETHTKSISQIILQSNNLNYYYITEKHLSEINKESPYSTSHNIQIECQQ